MTLPPYIRATADGVIVKVFVQPRAAKDALVGIHGDALKVKLRAPPLDDRANRALERFLAEAVGVSSSDVRVVRGATSRHKEVAVAGLDPGDGADALGRVLSSRAHKSRDSQK